MTREILFRAKSVSSNQWVYGNYIHSKRFAGWSNEHRIHNQETGLESDVYPETVGQFTGVFDRKGRQVFEGDIFFEEVKTDEGDVRMYCVVVWLPTKAGFATLNRGEYLAWTDLGDECLDPSEYYEIDQKGILRMHYAGNIHDNPELLAG